MSTPTDTYSQYVQRGDISGAFAVLNRQLAEPNPDPKVLLNRALLRLQVEDTAGALADYDAFIGLFPHDPEGHARKGNAFMLMGEFEAGERCLNYALKLEPTHAYANCARGLLHFQLDEFEQAERLLSFAVDQEPTSRELHMQRGNARMQMDNLDGAVADADWLVQHYPDVHNYFFRARVHHFAMNSHSALRDLTQTLELEPQYVSARLLRSEVLAELERYPEALADTKWLVQHFPNQVEYRLQHAERLLDSGNHAACLAELEEAIKQDPRNTEILSQQATVYMELQQPEQALEKLNKALAYDGHSPELLVERAFVYATLGNYAQAEHDVQHALQHNPELADAWTARGMLALEQSQLEQAMLHFARAAELGDITAVQILNQMQSMMGQN
jgi:tetratricopeptide (TPR) repeat protein